MTVAAGVNQSATTGNGIGAVGGAAVGAVLTTALVSGTSRAYIGDGTRLSAGSLTVEVRNSLDNTTVGDALRTATATTTVGSEGILAGAGSTSTAVINGSLEALIGTTPPSSSAVPPPSAR